MREGRHVSKDEVLGLISRRMVLSEGVDAVRRVLREIYRRGRVGTKDLAYATLLPIPVVAAIRRELERIGLITRRGGAMLTELGRRYAEEALGLRFRGSLLCPSCNGRRIVVADEFQGMLEKMRVYAEMRPRPYTWLDQAFCTPETSVYRAMLMLEEGDVEGRDIIFLGDDDLTSVAVGLLKSSRRIVVVDVDERLLSLIGEISRREGMDIECIRHDLRDPLPEDLRNRFDVVFTDPPYTVEGMSLFVSRGIDALKEGKCMSIYLSYAHKPPEEMLKLQRAINEMGLFIRELIPRFNRYEGAEMFANTTFIAKLETTDEAHPLISGRFDGKIYTGEASPKLRLYKCRCGHTMSVGVNGDFRTIEDLKSSGCPRCGRKSGFQLVRRIPHRPSGG